MFFCPAHVTTAVRTEKAFESILLCLSPTLFSRVVEDSGGLTLDIRRRVERARELLRDGGNIAQVAVTVGFASQSHLHSYIQREFGCTPRPTGRAASWHLILVPDDHVVPGHRLTHGLDTKSCCFEFFVICSGASRIAFGGPVSASISYSTTTNRPPRFLDRHGGVMPRAMLRYAIERFPPDQRCAYLQKTTWGKGDADCR